MKKCLLTLGAFLYLALPLLAQDYVPEPGLVKALPPGLFAFVHTGAGTMVFRLEAEKAPLTVLNFVGLAEGSLEPSTRRGQPFYDGLVFHRVIKNFMIQGGDPEGTGAGGPGYHFADEFDPELRFDKAGVLAMANSGPAINGSQFFITHGPTPWLNDKHTIFGQLLVGQDIADTITQGEEILALRIVRKGPAAQAFIADHARFNALSAELAANALTRLKDQVASQEAQLASQYPHAVLDGTGLRSIQTKAPSSTIRPTSGQTLKVIMKGRLANGQQVQFSPDNGPLKVSLGTGRLPQGFELAFKSMGTGEQRTFIIPPNLAFGELGYPPVIPPWSYLVLDVELLSIAD